MEEHLWTETEQSQASIAKISINTHDDAARICEFGSMYTDDHGLAHRVQDSRPVITYKLLGKR